MKLAVPSSQCCKITRYIRDIQDIPDNYIRNSWDIRDNCFRIMCLSASTQKPNVTSGLCIAIIILTKLYKRGNLSGDLFSARPNIQDIQDISQISGTEGYPGYLSGIFSATLLQVDLSYSQITWRMETMA